jgi:hypothetical protein
MKMEDKKMPFAVFVLKSMENQVKDYKEDGRDEFEVLADVVECEYCPLHRKQCAGYAGPNNCKAILKRYVESAE